MGLFDRMRDLSDGMKGNTGTNPVLLDSVTDMFKGKGSSSMINNFQTMGLMSILKSWVGKGKNEDISSDQVKDVVGKDKIREMSEKTGMSEDDVSKQLKDILPDMINKCTPKGKFDDDDDFDDMDQDDYGKGKKTNKKNYKNDDDFDDDDDDRSNRKNKKNNYDDDFDDDDSDDDDYGSDKKNNKKRKDDDDYDD